jgi:branched-chain amino acid transport system substrate-binding protein
MFRTSRPYDATPVVPASGFMRNALAVLALALSGCAQSTIGNPPATASIDSKTAHQSLAGQPVTDQKAKAVKIALILPLGGYGDPAQIARGMKQAAEMALIEADNPSVQLITKDDGGTPQGAMAAADAAIGEGAEIILGPLFGKSAAAIGPIAAKAGIPVISFSNDPTVAGRGVYLMSFLASEEVNRVVSYAAGQGKKRFAALIPDTAYGKTVEPAFRSAVKKAGGEIVAIESYPADASGTLQSAKKVVQVITDAGAAGSPVDALFIPAGQESISHLGPLLAYAGLTNDKLKLLGTSAWDVPIISRDDALIGGWYAASDPSGWAAFADKYRKNFGTAPPRLATLSYDAMSMTLQLAKNAGPGRFSADKLTRAEGFSGIDGTIRLMPGGLSHRVLAVLEIQKYSSAVIDGADADAQAAASAPPAVSASLSAQPHL